MKIVIAAVYAEAVDAGDIDPDEAINLDDLERFHMENTEGGAHPQWLDQLDSESEDTVPLQEVVEGMIVFSSNANTDFLLEKIGIESINERLEEWGLTDHDPVYPLVSPLLMYEDIGEEAASLPMEDYRSQVELYHEAIVQGELDASAEGFTLSMDEQRMWSDRLPAATAASYGEWLHDIHTDEWSNEGATAILMDILEAGTADIEGIESFGQKGGSTAFVLNQAMYATTEDGNVMELVVLNDDLSWWQSFKLGRNMSIFIEQFFEDKTFREEILEAIAD
ncbi:serine hydrolase [Salicibibacter cibarius]|uniref:Serine hydrolase n=1 Tax=Salicibibacter cibarius TaxID=2743000 RepID=A0A7T6Z5T1_9BACI|nr:serine hydrolase [Salicibibacter cibarius]QQK77446.1 serine hydrolase [Salicibibacter cibarius]